MPWNIEPIQLLTAVFTLFIVPGITGFIASKFGVRRALESARRERAFDQSLKWYESTLRIISEFQVLTKKFDEVGSPTLENIFNDPKRAQELAVALRECASKLRAAVFEALLFADKETIKELRSTTEVLERVSIHADRVADSRGDAVGLWYESQRLGITVSGIQWSLVHAFRKQLGLQKLSSTDLGFDPGLSRSFRFLLRHPSLIRLVRLPMKLFPRATAKLVPEMYRESRKVSSNPVVKP